MTTQDAIKFIDLEQGSDLWKEFRKMKIGSSSAASIRGVGFKTPLQLFEDMIEDRETPVNDAMKRGTEMEPKARAWLNNKYGADLQPAVVQHPNDEFDWHISSLDGIWKRSDNSYFVTEIKHPGRKDHECAMDGLVPEKYIPQCLHILEDLPGVDEILYLSYHEDSQAEIWVKRDEYEMPIQFAEELSFYTRLLSFLPPDPCERDWIEFREPSIISRANTYSLIKDQIEELQKEADRLKEELKQCTLGVPRAIIGDLKLQKVIRQGAVEYSRIEALKGLDLNPYRKEPIVSWRLS
jgi:putative phage-type endonuclease